MTHPPADRPTLSPGQAAYVLDRLITDRRVSHMEVNAIVADMGREIRELEEKLQGLREAAGGSFVARGTSKVGNGAPAALKARKEPRASARRKRGRPVGSGNKAQAQAATRDAETGAKPARRKRRFTVTAKVLASREIQGRYLPLLNRFQGRQRAAFVKTAKEKGREAAIAEMEAASKK